jgi:Tfp pilus assembly protein PilE
VNVDVALAVQVVSLLGSAAVVSWRFSALATDMKALAAEMGKLATAFEKDREKGEASRLELGKLTVKVLEHEGRLDALEEKA